MLNIALDALKESPASSSSGLVWSNLTRRGAGRLNDVLEYDINIYVDLAISRQLISDAAHSAAYIWKELPSPRTP